MQVAQSQPFHTRINFPTQTPASSGGQEDSNLKWSLWGMTESGHWLLPSCFCYVSQMHELLGILQAPLSTQTKPNTFTQWSSHTHSWLAQLWGWWQPILIKKQAFSWVTQEHWPPHSWSPKHSICLSCSPYYFLITWLVNLRPSLNIQVLFSNLSAHI